MGWDDGRALAGGYPSSAAARARESHLDLRVTRLNVPIPGPIELADAPSYSALLSSYTGLTGGMIGSSG
jgi:hypothetical protein